MKIAIIGGSGKMGRWFARQLAKNGYDVVITGRDRSKLEEAGRELEVATASNAEAVRNADAVIISVPPDNFEETVKSIYPYFRPGQIVLDVTSVKVSPVEIMHKYIKQGLALGTHPMFGPGAEDVAGHNIVLTPTTDAETALAYKIKSALEARGTHVMLMSPAEHDDMMAIVLGLTHFVALVSADTLLACDRQKASQAVSGTSYKVLLTLIGSVVSQDAEFYASLQTSLPGMDRITGTLAEKVKAWASLVKGKDKDQFSRQMSRLREELQKEGFDFDKAYRDMYRIVEFPKP